MSPRSASSRAGTSRSSEVPAPEPLRTVPFDLIVALPRAVLLRVWAGGEAKAIDRPKETGQIVAGQLCASTEVSPKNGDPGRIERMARAATLASKMASDTAGIGSATPSAGLRGRAVTDAEAGRPLLDVRTVT